MPLGVVAEVVAQGGYLPQLAQLDQKKPIFSKKSGVVVSIVWFIFFTCFCTAFFGILNAPEELIGILAITGFFGGLIMMILSLIFLKSSKQFPLIPAPGSRPHKADELYPHFPQAALPPQQSVPASFYAPPQAGNWRDTNDLQPSVTESTTKLLDKEDAL